MKKTKSYVLDTNVILHALQAPISFMEHDVCIPIEVISELDHFKNGFEEMNFNCRKFINLLDSLPPERIFDGGASLGNNLGKIRVIMSSPYHKELEKYFPEKTNDHLILNTVFCMSQSEEYKDSEIVLVSKDVNLRIKAKSLGLKAEDYKTDIVTDLNSLYPEVKSFVVPDEIINTLYSEKEIDYKFEEVLRNNEFLILNPNTKKSALAIYKNKKTLCLIEKDKVSVFGIKPRNSEQAFALNVLLDPNIKLVTMIGIAGAGKTLLSVVAAMELLDKNIYEEVYFTRQTVPLGNKEVGYLPGNLLEKTSPFMQGMTDNLGVIKSLNTKNLNKISKMQSDGKITIEPLSVIRGRSIVKRLFIIDEAQNLTPQEAKAIISRAGEGTKVVLLGDITQSDVPYLNETSNGISYTISTIGRKHYAANVVLTKGERSEMAGDAGTLM